MDTLNLECTLAFLFVLGMFATGHWFAALGGAAFLVLRASYK